MVGAVSGRSQVIDRTPQIVARAPIVILSQMTEHGSASCLRERERRRRADLHKAAGQRPLDVRVVDLFKAVGERGSPVVLEHDLGKREEVQIGDRRGWRFLRVLKSERASYLVAFGR